MGDRRRGAFSWPDAAFVTHSAFAVDLGCRPGFKYAGSKHVVKFPGEISAFHPKILSVARASTGISPFCGESRSDFRERQIMCDLFA